MADYPDWMKSVASKLTNLPLNRIPLPGSHDAGSYGGITTRSMTQGLSIADQLKAGVRYFDFRFRIDNGEFFSHHGSDESRDNPYCHYKWNEEYEKKRSSIFYQVKAFCNLHPSEIVILNLYDFSSVWGQSFNYKDGQSLIHCINDCFGSLLIPRSASIPTYGSCISNKQQVLVVNNDKGDNAPDIDVTDGNPAAVDGDEIPDATNAERKNIWKMSESLKERFSNLGYATWTWKEMVDGTIEDQYKYLLKTTPDGRDLSRFWISQSILGYNNMNLVDDHSQNFAGSNLINPLIIEEYKKWWNGEGGAQQPNILLLDFSGIHGDFVPVCQGLLNGSF